MGIKADGVIIAFAEIQIVSPEYLRNGFLTNINHNAAWNPLVVLGSGRPPRTPKQPGRYGTASEGTP